VTGRLSSARNLEVSSEDRLRTTLQNGNSFEAWKKGEVDAAIKKKMEEKQKKLQAIPWFFLYAHILFIIEYLIYRNIWG